MSTLIRKFKATQRQEEIQELVSEFKTISRLRRDAYGRLVKANKEGQEQGAIRDIYLELTKYREILLDSRVWGYGRQARSC